MCVDNNYLDIVKKLNYVPVGLKNKNFSNEWITDNSLINISEKNPYYGEYTFYYWYWKNILKKKKKDEWVGFCSYRELWGEHKNIKDKKSIKSLLKYLPKEWENYESIIGEPIFLKRPKISKILKKGKIALIRNYKEVFKSKYSIRLQFDMFHGNGVLDKAIELLSDKDKQDFKNYIINNTSYNKGNMFICKSKKIINEYYKTIFEWLNDCEKIFGFDLDGYGKARVYAFLAERFLPYWFNKYVKTLEWPIIFNDLTSEINK